jgi:hypothetical protein
LGLYFTARTLRISQETLRVTQEGQITERFTKAIEQLGDKEHLMVRLGGIYALEQIARDSKSHHWAVMEVLTAFVREPALATAWHIGKPPPDIQAILTVIGRRTRTFGNGEALVLDLSYTYLRYANLVRAHLEGAFLRGAQLKGAGLMGAQLEGAGLMGAQLEGAGLMEAQLEGADLMGAQLEGADLRGAQLERTILRQTDLTKVRNLTQAQIDRACTDEHTKLPEGLTRPAPCPANP